MNTTQLTFCRLALVALIALLPVTRTAAAEEVETKADSVLFKERTIMARAEGKDFQSTNLVVLPGGVKVRTNGVFTVGAGKERQLLEGQRIDVTGMLASPDGTVVPVSDHLILRSGRLNLVKDGESKTTTSNYRLADGTSISPDGTVSGADRRIRRLLDGQVFKLDGSTLSAVDTVTRIKGEIVLQKDGGRVSLSPTQKIMMSDGTRVSGDGTVTRPDGTKTVVKEGEVLRIEGVKGPRP